MIRSFMGVKRLTPADRAFRAQFSLLSKQARRLHEGWKAALEMYIPEQLHKKILLESGCLGPMLKGEALDFDALLAAATVHRDQMVRLYGEDPGVKFDSVRQEVTGEPIEQEKQEDAELRKSARFIGEEEQPSAGEPVPVVLDWGHLGSDDSPDHGDAGAGE